MLYFLNCISLCFLIIIFTRFADKLKLLDIPNYRKTHFGNIPLIGGICIFINLIIFSQFFELTDDFLLILYSSISLVILGAIDDMIDLGYKFRLFSQLGISLILCGSGLYIYSLGNYGFGDLNLGYFSIVFTIICVVGLTNSFNFLDGIDGLCSGIFLVSLLSFLLFIYFLNLDFNYINIFFFIIIFINVLIFMFFNLTTINKIFLGDSGSTSLGFLISWILIIYSQISSFNFHPVLVIWCVTFPVFDMIAVVLRRLYFRKNPFHPDKSHMHFLLLNIINNRILILFIILFLSVFLNFLGFFCFYYFGSFTSLLMFILLFILYLYFSIKIEIKSKNLI